MEKVKRHTRRTGIAIAGGIVLVAGILMIPYPGPGWLTVFAGLAILSSEFLWAKRLLDEARSFYTRWQQWLKKQNIFVQWLFLALTGLVIVTTIWLLNGFGIMARLLDIQISWLYSPLLRF